MHSKRWLIVLGVVGVVLIGLLVAAKLTLRSSFAAHQVAAQIAEAAGTPVQVGSLDVGLTGSTLYDLKFYEEGASESVLPWAVIPQVSANLSLTQLVRGELAGGTVTLHNPTITLRLNDKNELETKLPSPEGAGRAWPAFRLDNGKVIFQRAGQPDTVFAGLQATIRKDGDHITLEGAADDQEWGRWTVHGDRASADAPFALTLHTDNLSFTPEKLRGVPFVPPVVWEQIQPTGQTPVDLALRFGGNEKGGPPVRYRVALTPRDTSIRVSAIDLTTQNTHGGVLVEDGIVHLRDLQAQAAGGSLRTDATMDFSGAGSVFLFNVKAEKLQTKQLPAKWGLPPWDGRLSGQAHMEVAVRDGQVQTSGQGQGALEGVFSGPPLQVRMLADRGGYRFDISNEAGTPTGKLSDASQKRSYASAKRRETGPSEVISLPALAAALVLLQPPAAAPPPPQTGASAQLVPPARPAAPDQPRDLQVNLSLKDIDLTELIQRLEVKLPFKLTGKLTFRVQLRVPLSNVRDLKAYHFDGSVNLPWARIEDLELRDVKAHAVYDQGVLRLEELSTQVPSGQQPGAPVGSLNGSAQLQVVPAGDLTARLTVKALPIGPLLAALPNAQAHGGGTADGALQIQAPAAALRDLGRWQGNANLTARKVQAFGRSAEELAVQVNLQNGVLNVAEAKGRLNGAAVTGTGQLHVTTPYQYEAHVKLPPSELRAWQQVVPELRSVRLAGQAQATADVQGTLQPLVVNASGTARVDGLAVNAFQVGTMNFRWDANTDRLRLSDFAANLYGGDLTGSATVPLKATVPGRVELHLSKLNTTNLTRDVPQTPVRLEGTAAGSVTINLPPAPPGRDREITADVQLKAEGLRVQNIPTDELQAAVTYRNGVADYKITGKALGGTFDINGQYPSAPANPPAPPPKQGGHVSIRGIDLGRLGGALRSDALRPLGGVVSLSADYTLPDNVPTGAGQFSLDNLSWGGRTLIDSLRGEIVLRGGEISFPELAGQLAGGALRVRVTYNLHQPRRSIAVVTLDRADAQGLLAPFMASPPVDGPVSARLYARLGDPWTGTGQVLLARGKLFGLTVGDARFPLNWQFASGGAGTLRVTDASAQASRGRLTARAELIWGYETRLDGQVRFSALDVAEMLSHYTETRVASGLASGRVDFGGRNIRSASDLTARVEAKLAQTSAMQAPVLRQITPFVLPGVGANITFTSGDLRGALAGGVFRIDQLSLVGDLARLFINGTVTLQQRLNLDVVANTQQLGMDPLALRVLGLSLPAVGPIPLSLINQASAYLSNRTIRLRVTGTIRAPSIQVNPLPLLSEAAVRFFLAQTGVPLPSSVPIGAVPGP